MTKMKRTIVLLIAGTLGPTACVEGPLLCVSPFDCRTDAVFSPHGSVPMEAGADSPDGQYVARQIEPALSGQVGIFDRADAPLNRIDESHGSANDLKGLAWSPDSTRVAIMFHGGNNRGVWVREALTGDLVARVQPTLEVHYMVFDETGASLLFSADGRTILETLPIP